MLGHSPCICSYLFLKLIIESLRLVQMTCLLCALRLELTQLLKLSLLLLSAACKPCFEVLHQAASALTRWVVSYLLVHSQAKDIQAKQTQLQIYSTPFDIC